MTKQRTTPSAASVRHALTFVLLSAASSGFILTAALFTPPALALAFCALFAFALFLASRLHTIRSSRPTTPAAEQLAAARASSALHFRALEALAQAIDSKDQTTPGHVRRTQVYAVELGRLLGLGPDEIEALRAGALLHDVGKLAVPDHILNKPGELTPAEFEKVKVHASVGADVIRQVNFPYPVEDVVRHHHEKWDGTGYPSGLRGSVIPVTAQVIGVVDFYDVSRCDRPYRAGSTRQESLALLRQMAGTYFDPGLVELFAARVAEFDRLIPAQDLSEQVPDRARPVAAGGNAAANELPETDAAASADRPSGFCAIAAAQREVFALHDLALVVGSSLNLSDTLALVTSRLAGIVPFETCVIFIPDELTGRSVPAYACGADAEYFAGRVFAAGEGVTGWVVANNRPMRDAAPELDLPGAPADVAARIRSVLSAPLSREGGAFGAVTLYSSAEGFTAEHLRLLESACLHASGAVSNALMFERTKETALTDALTGLPNERALRLALEQRFAENRRLERGPVALLCLDLDGFRHVNERHGHGVGDRLLAAAADAIKRQLRDMDTLTRLAGDAFMALLPAASSDTAALVAERVRAAVESADFPTRAGHTERVGVSIGVAVYPEAGETPDAVIHAATRDMRRDKRARQTTRAPAPPGKVVRLDSFR